MRVDTDVGFWSKRNVVSTPLIVLYLQFAGFEGVIYIVLIRNKPRFVVFHPTLKNVKIKKIKKDKMKKKIKNTSILSSFKIGRNMASSLLAKEIGFVEAG